MEAHHTSSDAGIVVDNAEAMNQGDLTQNVHVASELNAPLDNTNTATEECNITDQSGEESSSRKDETDGITSQLVVSEPSAQASIISRNDDVLTQMDSLTKESSQPLIIHSTDHEKCSTDKADEKEISTFQENAENIITSEDTAVATGCSFGVGKDTVVVNTNQKVQGEEWQISQLGSQTAEIQNLLNNPLERKGDQLSDNEREPIDGSEILATKSQAADSEHVDIHQSSICGKVGSAEGTDCIISDSVGNTPKEPIQEGPTKSAKLSMKSVSEATTCPLPVALIYNAEYDKHHSSFSMANDRANEPDCDKSAKEMVHVSSCNVSSESHTDGSDTFRRPGSETILTAGSDTMLTVSKESSAEKGNDFQPIIVSVCGGYREENAEEQNERVTPCVASNVTETMKSLPKTAFELLQGMIQQVNSSNSEPQKTKESISLSETAKMQRNEATSSQPLILKKSSEQSSSESVVDSDSTVSIPSPEKSILSASSETMVHFDPTVKIPSRVKEPISTSSKPRILKSIVPQMFRQVNSKPKVSAPNTLPSVLVSSGNVMSSSTSQYSCVFVQDKSNSHQKVTLLIPQTSFHNQCLQRNSLATEASESVRISKGSQPVISQNKSNVARASLVGMPAKSVEPLSVCERISNMIERTLNNFQVTGADLKNSSLLLTSKLHEQEEQPNDSNLFFPCSVCGERFYEETGLMTHLSRTVFLLSYQCDYCQETFVFINKCQLYMHSKKEEKHPTINYDNILHLKPYDFSADIDTPYNDGSMRFSKQAMLGSQITAQELEKHENGDRPPCSESNQNSIAAQNVNPGHCQSINTLQAASESTLYASVQNKSSQQVVITSTLSTSSHMINITQAISGSTLNSNQPDQCLKGTTIAPSHGSALPLSNQGTSLDATTVNNSTEKKGTGIQCCTCKANFSEKRQLAEHLSCTTQFPHECSSCEIFSPTVCSLQAHMKIHSLRRLENMCCPECGEEKFDSIRSFDLRPFFDHLDACKHFNRLLVIPCVCGQEFLSTKLAIKHFVGAHLKTLFKCTNCVLAFTDFTYLMQHAKSVHNLFNNAFVNKFAQPTLLCTSCQQILRNPVEAKTHVESHIAKQKLYKGIFKWKCFVCSKAFDDKNKLNEHSETEHTYKPKRCTICFSLFSNRKNLVDHIVLRRCNLIPRDLNYNLCVDIVTTNQEADEIEWDKLFETNTSTGILRHTQSKGLVRIAPKSKPPETAGMIQTSEPPQVTSLENSKNRQQSFDKSVCAFSAKSKSVKSNNTKDKIVYQCHLCHVYFVGTHNYVTHLRHHAMRGKHISMDVTRCVVCKKLIMNSSLQQHLKGHQAHGVIICCRCQRRDFKTMALALKHGDNICGYRRVEGCGDLDAIEAEKARETVEQQEEDMHESESTKNGEDETSLTVFPCHLCGLAFQNVAAREEHVSRLHDGTRMVYHCLVCKRKRGRRKVFRKWESASRHIAKKHRITTKTSIEKLIRTEEQNVSSGQELPLPVTTQTKDTTEEPSAPKRLRIAAEGDFLCGKCGFSCSGGEDFSQHIQIHNSSKEPQCPECGLCFTILPALKKHLFAVHKIRNIDDYLKQKDIIEPEVEEDDWMEEMPGIQSYYSVTSPSSESSAESAAKTSNLSSKPFECTVCYKGFDSETDVKTHMRTHGMAFIKSKRQKP